MTPDDKRRLAALRARYRGLQGDMPPFGDVITLLRLLDEATAERDAAMAALLGYGEAAEYFFENIASVTTESDAADVAIDLLKAAHSAATKQADPVEKAGSDG